MVLWPGVLPAVLPAVGHDQTTQCLDVLDSNRKRPLRDKATQHSYTEFNRMTEEWLVYIAID